MEVNFGNNDISCGIYVSSEEIDAYGSILKTSESFVDITEITEWKDVPGNESRTVKIERVKS